MDFIRDQNPTALFEVGIKAGENLPHYVKEATMLQEEDIKDLHDCAFADPANRLHPIHTKAATYMSAVYLAGAGKVDTSEFRAVKNAAKLFGISEDVENAISYLPQASKQASAVSTDMYALNFQMEEDDTWQSYPIKSEIDVTKSATEVVRDWVTDHIPTDWFFHAARNIVKRANELGIPRNSIPDRVWNMGEERMVDFDNAEYAVSERAFIGIDTDEYAKALKQASAGNITVEDAIDMWMSLDTANKVNHRKVTTPQEAFYSGMKMATVESLAASNILIADVLIPVDAAAKLLSNDGRAVKMAFRKETAETIIEAVKQLENKDEKSAAITTSKLASLNKTQQKELLNVLLKVA